MLATTIPIHELSFLWVFLFHSSFIIELLFFSLGMGYSPYASGVTGN